VYNSLYLDPCTSGVDAFAQDWSQTNTFTNPPFALLHWVTKQLCQQGATATIIAPKWTSQPWYKELKRMAVAPPIRLPMSKQTLVTTGRAEQHKTQDGRLTLEKYVEN